MSPIKEWGIEPEEESGKEKETTSRPSSVYIEDDEEFKQRKYRKSTSIGSSTVDSNENRSASTSSRSDSNRSRSSATKSWRNYTVSELINSIENDDDHAEPLPPDLERRVRDFKFAQNKRREKQGSEKPFGIFGLYAHLSEIRADLEWAEDAAWRRHHGHPYLSWTDFETSRAKGHNLRPIFTYAVIALCSIMFLVTFIVNDGRIERMSVNPLIGPSSDTLIQVGARHTSKIVNDGQWYRIFTPILLHAGLIHFVINMLAMWYIGAAVEQSHGLVSAAILFIVPAVGGNVLSAMFLPQQISVGASGGIFGLIGGCAADIYLNWNLLFLKTANNDGFRSMYMKVLFWLLADIFVNLLIGFTPFVDNFTHLGGFLYGLFCGLSTIEKLALSFFGLSSGKYSAIRNTVVRYLGLILSVFTIMITTILLSQSDGNASPCHACRYISCVPFPFRAEDKWWYCDDCDFVVADLFQSTDGSKLYEMIELTCPSGEITEIAIAEDGYTEKEQVRRQLPTYCRKHCNNVFDFN